MRNYVLKHRHKIALAALIMVAVFSAYTVRAETIDELKQSIEAKNQEVKKLEEEAAKFRQEIVTRQSRAKTLAGELKRIDALIAQLRKEIALTNQKITKKELEIRALGLDISTKEQSIVKVKQGISATIREISQSDRETLLATIIKYAHLSDFLQQIDHSAQLQRRMLGAIATLRQLRTELQGQKTDAEHKQAELKTLQQSLSGQRAVQEGQKRSRNDLLALTKNQEQQYQKLLRDSEAKRKALAEEIQSIEAKIRVTIDPSLLPSHGRGVLGPPLPNLSISPCTTTLKQGSNINCLTQYFGYTSFAAVGAYQGKGHNGTDFRADIGTPVFAAEAGIVTAIGDTDRGCAGASYGKWILIKHTNNLSTLFAHLSAISTSAGQQVSRGAVIGYSGMTGYATGPHLHFTVFATQGVQVQDIRSRVCGRMMTLPISAINAYLNPLDYL